MDHTEEGYPIGLTPDQAIRAITEESICLLEEASSSVGRVHRIIITDHVLPSATQLQYLHKSWTEIGKVISLVNDLSVKSANEG